MKEEQLYEELFDSGKRKVDYRAMMVDYVLRWPFILGFLVLSLVGAYVYLRYQAPVYGIDSTVMIKQGDKTKSTAATALASMQDLGTMSMANNFDNEIEILQSYSLIKKVVKSQNLYVTYFDKRKFGYDIPAYKNVPVNVWMAPDEAERLPSALSVSVACRKDGSLSVDAQYTVEGETHTESKTFKKAPAVFVTRVGTLTFTPDSNYAKMKLPREFTAMVAPPSVVTENYKARLHAEPTSEFTTIVCLSFNDTDVRRAQDFLSALVRNYNADANEDKNQVASRTAKFIEERIRIINEELGSTENELASYKQSAGLTDLSADAQLALQETSEYDRKRAENASQLRLVGFLREYIDNPDNEHEVIPSDIGISDADLTGVIAKYNEMQIERKRLLRTSKVNNPVVVNLDASINATHNAVVTAVDNVEKALRITRRNLDLEAGRYRSRVSSAPRQEKVLTDITRQQEIKANLYLTLLQKREENAITLAATADNSRVVEEPRAVRLVAPNKRNIYAMAFVVGLLFPIACVWLSLKLRFKIEGRADVEKLTDVPIVGDIPQVKDHGESAVVVSENKNGVMEEVFRNVRTNLQYMLQDDEKVILVTSTTPGEGKSFTAANLATSFALMDRKTLIVGMDIRKPALNKIFNLPKEASGITRYLASPKGLDVLSLCQRSALSPNLYVLPVGEIPPNPTELVARKSLDEAFAQLRQHFDYIIIDSAPMGVVTDTRLIARVADICAYICRADYTRKSDFELINDLKREKKMPLLCVLVNGIDMDKRKNGYYYGYGKYGRYGKYAYGKKYGHGYGYGKEE